MLRAPSLLIASACAAFAQIPGAFSGSLDHPSIEYATRPTKDPVAELNRKLDSGALQLTFDPTHGYLRSVLDALKIPVESQMAVFSKTSFQARLISPSNPRALYFNDSVSVGWVRGGSVMELVAHDPEQGAIFYVLPQNQTGTPRFTRRDACLQCHESYSTLGVPGMLLGSVFPAPNGVAMFQFGSYIVDHRTPLNQRRGGWYVSGVSRQACALCNAVFEDPEKPITRNFDPDGYLSPHSDVVALMVFEHQMRMTNLLTRIGWEARLGSSQLAPIAKELVDYMLFLDEAPLKDRAIGTSGFAEKFAAQGPRDHKGRSLRDFDLTHRMMRYPCSYMIYSDAFDALPRPAKDAIYARMREALSKLPGPDRQAIVEILRDTKPDFSPSEPRP